MITKDQIRDILSECLEIGLPETIGDDTPLVLDSYAGTWIQYLLEERLGVIVSLNQEVANSIGSVGALHAFVVAAAGTGAPGETTGAGS